MLPPVARLRFTLNTIWMAHSVIVMIKGVTPSEVMSATRRAVGRISFTRNRNRLFLVKKKTIMHTQDSSWDRIVARLEPRTPMPRVKINSGSSAMLVTAPMSTEPMARNE